MSAAASVVRTNTRSADSDRRIAERNSQPAFPWAVAPPRKQSISANSGSGYGTGGRALYDTTMHGVCFFGGKVQQRGGTFRGSLGRLDSHVYRRFQSELRSARAAVALTLVGSCVPAGAQVTVSMHHLTAGRGQGVPNSVHAGKHALVGHKCFPRQAHIPRPTAPSGAEGPRQHRASRIARRTLPTE